MTLPLGNRNDYTGNNTTADYDYTFRIIADTDLVVTVIALDGTETTLDLTDDYTVTGAGEASGGEISLVDDGQAWLDDDGYLDADYDIVIRRVRPIIQETDIRNQGDFYPESHEDAFDHLVMIAQQQQEELDRCVQAGVGATPPTLKDITDAVDDAQSAQAAAEAAEVGAETAQGLAEDARDAAEAAAGSVTLASQAEAEAGTDNTKYLSSLRTKQAMDKQRPVVAVALSVVTGAVATNASLGTVFTITADANFTLSNPTNAYNGQKIIWRIKQDAVGSRVITLGNKFTVATEVGTVVLSTAADTVDYLGAIYNATADKFEVVAFAMEQA